MEDSNSKEVYSTSVNGRYDFENSASNPLARKEIKYWNPTAGKYQTQNYLDMQDIVVPVILKRNDNGDLIFAMQYETIPAVNNIQLELPDCPFFDGKKSQYSNGDVTTSIDNKMIGLGLEMEGFKYLDVSETAISQSFTDQMQKVVAVYVKDNNADNNLKWFPISSLEDFLSNKGNISSLQTKYALELFYKKYQDEIKKYPATEFEYDKKVIGQDGSNWKDVKNIMEHKYRFGIEMAEESKKNEAVEDFGQISEYGMSKNSVQCLIVKKNKDKIFIGLSKQQRSPFVERDGIDEYFYEAAAGIVENGEDYEEAAKRETVEETGIQIGEGKLIHISNPTLLSKATQEYSDFYLYEKSMEDNQREQNLDEQEDIGEIEWFDIDEIDLEKLHAPLPTKYLILKAKNYYQLERNKELNIPEEDNIIDR